MNSRGPYEEVKSLRVLRSNFKWNGRAAIVPPLLGVVRARRSPQR